MIASRHSADPIASSIWRYVTAKQCEEDVTGREASATAAIIGSQNVRAAEKGCFASTRVT